jgi:hypothetical protein
MFSKIIEKIKWIFGDDTPQKTEPVPTQARPAVSVDEQCQCGKSEKIKAVKKAKQTKPRKKKVV